jgi:hypothetical protein
MYEKLSNLELVKEVLKLEDANFIINEYAKHMMTNSRNSVTIDCLLVCYDYLNEIHNQLGCAIDDETILLKDQINQSISDYNENKDIDPSKIIPLSRNLIKSIIDNHNIKSYDDFTCEHMKNLAKEFHLLD